MSIVRDLVQRADSWVNAMTGLGTLRDKLMHAQVVAGNKLTDPTLESLFNDDDVARRVVAKLPREATRRGFYIEIQETEPEPGSDVEDDDDEPEADPQARKKEAANIERQMLVAFEKLEAMPKLRDAWIWARLYGGGSGLLVGADDGLSVEQPLNEAAIRSIKFLNIVKRPQLSVSRRYEDVREPKYGQPELYLVSQTSAALAPREGLLVHESRLILFDGALTARMTDESPTGFDDSVLQSTYTPLQQTSTAWQSVAHLMTDASQGVLKIANLVDLVAAGGAETLRARIQLMDLARSVCRSILVDAEKESFERVSTSFAGLPEVMDKLMMRMSAAAEQPVTLLYGRSPAGMNATGESDIRGWYDTVAEAQTDELKPRLQRLLTLMFLAKDSPTAGQVPEQWCIEFNPLWLPTDKEEADTKKVRADTYVALVGGNIMTDAEAGIGLASDFPEIDVEARTALAEADAEEGVRPREVNTPEPPPMPGGPGGEGGDDPEGGGNSKAPKADRADSQPRVPAGSSRGGQWTSGGGGGGVVPSGPAGSGKLTDEQRARVGTVALPAAQRALRQQLVQRYGVPAEQAAILWERDIKLQMKAAKAQRAAARAEKTEAKRKVDEALSKSKGALDKAIAAKKASDEAKAKAGDEAKKIADDKAKAKADKARERRRQQRQAKTEKRLKDEAEKKKQLEEAAKKSASTVAELDAANRGKHPDVDAHETALKAKYGDAARAVAWGRAMHDRGRAMDPGDYAKTMESLGLEGFAYHDRIAFRDQTRGDKKAKTMGEVIDRLHAEGSGSSAELSRKLAAGAAVAAHRKALEAAGATHAADGIQLKPLHVVRGHVALNDKGVPIKDPTTGKALKTGYTGNDANLEDVKAGIEGARKHFVALAHKDIVQPSDYKFKANWVERAHCASKKDGHYENEINTGAEKMAGVESYRKTMMHEMSHAHEAENPTRLAKSLAYLEARAKGASTTRYKYGRPDEIVYEQKKTGFVDEYQGKIYKNHRGKMVATEIASMSVQELSHGGDWSRYYKADRDSAHYALGFLANQ